MRTIEDMLDEVENANGGEGPDPVAGYDGAVLRAIMDIVDERDDAIRRLRAAVGRAREVGASWAAIGACLGVSRQAALKRYGADAA